MNNLLRITGYFAANLLQAIAGFFSIPLLVNMIGTNEFGHWALIEPMVQIMVLLALLGSNWGILKLLGNDNLEMRKTLHSLLKISQATILAMSILAFVVASNYGLDKETSIKIGILVYSESSLALILAGFRGANHVLGYFLGVGVKQIAILALLLTARYTSLFQINTTKDVIGVWVLSSCTGLAVGYFALGLKKDQRQINDNTPPPRLYKMAILYGFPLLLSSLLGLIQTFSDRYILKYFFPISEIGLYVVYLKIANAFNFVTSPIGLWWPTARFNHISDHDKGSNFFSIWSFRVLIFYLSCSCGLWLISPYLVNWFSPGSTARIDIIGFLILSLFFNGAAVLLNIGLLKEGKTHLNIYIAMASASAQVLLCLILIPIFGILGASLGLAFCSFFSLIVQNVLSQKIHPIDFLYTDMLICSFIFITGAIAIQHLLPENTTMWKLLVEGCIIATYLLIKNNLIFGNHHGRGHKKSLHI